MSTVEDMSRLLGELSYVIKKLNEETSKIENTEITALCAKHTQVKFFKDSLEEVAEGVDVLFNRLNSEDLPHCFEKLGLDSVKINGRTYTPSAKMHFNIREDNEKVAHQWLIDNGLSAIIKEKVNPKTLTAALVEHFTNTAEMPPPDLIPSYSKKVISVRKI